MGSRSFTAHSHSYLHSPSHLREPADGSVGPDHSLTYFGSGKDDAVSLDQGDTQQTVCDEGDNTGRWNSLDEESINLSKVKGHIALASTESWISVVLWQPLRWLRMLCRELHASFIFGVIATYGVSHGLGGALYRVAGDYYWKDVQKVQPSAAQFYNGIILSSRNIKLVSGLLTDVLPIAGYHRRPYFILSGLLVLFSSLLLAFSPTVSIYVAIILLVASSTGASIAEMTIDAIVARKSHEQPKLAVDMQTLIGMSKAMGYLFGYSSSGFAVDALNPKGALGLPSIFGVLFLYVGLRLHEVRTSGHSLQRDHVRERVGKAMYKLWKTLKCGEVWKPTVFLFMSFASSPSISEAKFYWSTDPKIGLGFSREFIGILYTAGAAGLILGTILYQKKLKHCAFRSILLWAQLLVLVGGTLDLMLVLRWNLKLHVPDSLFLLADEVFTASVSRIRLIPQLVLCAKLCPPGIEGIFFALLMSIENLGMLSEAWSGSFLLRTLGVTRQDYSNLWLATLIKNVVRVAPIPMLFLVPDCDPSKTVIPVELAALLAREEEEEEEEVVELVLQEKLKPNK